MSKKHEENMLSTKVDENRTIIVINLHADFFIVIINNVLLDLHFIDIIDRRKMPV